MQCGVFAALSFVRHYARMNIRIIVDSIALAEVGEIAEEFYKDMVKGVADVEREVIALGGEYHMDANAALIADGSAQDNLWGFNVYPERDPEDWIEYISLINIRPALGHRTLEIKDELLRGKIKAIIEKRIKRP